MSQPLAPLSIVDDVLSGAGFERTVPGLNGPPAFVGRVKSVSVPDRLIEVHPIAALAAGPLVVDPVVTIAAVVPEPELARITPHHDVVVCYHDGLWVAHPLPPLR